MSNETPVIINKKHGKHPPHGGGWKVAFADMMVALMAFFMLLWIMAASSQEEREEVASSIRSGIMLDEENLFTTPNTSLIDFGAIGGTKDGADKTSGSKGSSDAGALVTGCADGGRNGTPGKQGCNKSEAKEEASQQLKTLKKSVIQQFGAAQIAKHVKFEARPDGLRIVLSDNVDQLMFRRGSAEMEPFFQDLLLSLAELLEPYQQPMLVSGHTDSSPFSKASGNWRLSSQRALEAQRALELGGIAAKRFLHVAGYADKVPLDPEKPDSIHNRRVELFLLNEVGVERVVNSQRDLEHASYEATRKAQQNQARQLYQ